MAVAYQGTTDPRKLAENQRALIQQKGDVLSGQIQGQGDALNQQNAGQINEQTGYRGQTANYLDQIEDPLAAGHGGYNPAEVSQIQMTPEQQQQIVTGAGISAGAGTAAAVAGADRATSAAGGNPLAAAAYRARAASDQAANSGDAMTKARIGASDTAASREENIGQTRIGQQNQGLNYYQGQNQQANANVNDAAARQNQVYGTQTGGQNQEFSTQTSGTNDAAKTGLAASQTPTTFDKVVGAASGALKFLADGDYLDGETPDGSTPAVVGEDGPEAVVSTLPGMSSQPAGYSASQLAPGNGTQDPFWKRLLKGQQGQAPQAQPQRPWSPVDTYKSLGEAAGKVGSLLSDGRPPIFTKPTNVMLQPGEAAVPLGYRPNAKVRPSFAMDAMAGAAKRHPYGAKHA